MKRNYLSSWAQNVSPSLTLAVDAKAKALKAAGNDICSFGAGEPDFDTPDFIKEACIKALEQGKTKYLPSEGLLELRQAIAQQYSEQSGFPKLTEKNVVISPGGKFSCYASIMATCSPGDEVIVPSPFWVSYVEMIKLAGATPVVIKTSYKNAFKLTSDELKAAITPKTKLLILNSPSNPTGTVYTRSELEGLVEICLANDLLILSDEMYQHFVYDGATHHSPASFSKEVFERTLTVTGFSKTFSMTGWRLGTLVAPERFAKAVTDIQGHTTSNATSFAQYGALEAVRNQVESQKAIQLMRSTFDKRRQYFFNGLQTIPKMNCLKPQGAFYLFPKIDAFGLSSNDFAARLLETHNVAVVPGIAFGADAYIRLSYATSEAIIEKGLERIKAFCASL